MNAFAKFFKRMGTELPTPEELEKQRIENERLEAEREAQEKEKEKERIKAAREKAVVAKAAAKAAAAEKKAEESIEAAAAAAAAAVAATEKKQDPDEDPALPGSKDRGASEDTPQWPKKPDTSSSPAVPKDASVTKSPKLSMGLPPPGTVTKKGEKEEEVAEPAASADDDDASDLVIGSLEHRFVGLVIGKAGETIKSFKKLSGASIEIDQNLPDGLPRVVIYRGSKKQVAHAKKLVEHLVTRAKEDEKGKASATAPIGAGMGILGRGESKEKDVIKEAMSADKPPPKAAAGATAVAGEDAAKSDAALPPWRRAAQTTTSPGDEPQASAQPQVRPVEPLRRPLPNRRDAPWMKRDAEAAPAGSLTGALSGDTMMSMRPAWMKSSKGADADDGNNVGIDKSVWSEQRYGRSLMLTAKVKTHRGKAYEVPEEMMSMTTGPRPKYKPEKKEKEEEPPQESTTSGAKREQASAEDAAGSNPLGAAAPPQEEPPAPPSQVDASVENREEKRDSFSVGLYENLPGDSKDIMKLKKKLREIQKIEEGVLAKQKQEPNQVEKVLKKAGYLEELALLESIVHSAGVTNGS